MMKTKIHVCIAMAASLWLGFGSRAFADAPMLEWDIENQDAATFLYGEVRVLASAPNVSFAGANWYGVGGYCALQHMPAPDDFRSIFSVLDTSPLLHPKITEADHQALPAKSGGEGTGVHVDMLRSWKIGEPFRFFVEKAPAAQKGSTDNRLYFFDRTRKSWRHMASISSPNGEENSGALFSGVGSWLDNTGGVANAAAPKIALYSVWIGTSRGNLQHLTRATGRSGSGRWGQLHGEYFLAEGDPKKLTATFAKIEAQYGKPVFGKDGEELPRIAESRLPDSTAKELETLPHAPAFTGKLK